MPVDASNVLEKLADARHLDHIKPHFPFLEVDFRWTIKLCSAEIGSIRQVQGRAIKIVCLVHNDNNPDEKDKCKLMTSHRSQLRAAEAEIVKWAIAGTVLSEDDHKKASAELHTTFNEWVRSGAT